MAINLMCTNSDCRFYWEDNCTRNMNEERLEIDENGKCQTFEKGVSDWYKEEELAVPAENDSLDKSPNAASKWLASRFEAVK